MARSLNRASLIGNLTRDPELRYTPQGTAVCTFSVATNRQWKTESGDTKDEAEFHRIVAWDKLAEICSQLLGKGKRVFVEGRIQTRKWEDKDGNPRTTTEIVISDMLLLERLGESGSDIPQEKPPARTSKKKEESQEEEPIKDDDIPF
jgi:single-strand DNA-binding protein